MKKLKAWLKKAWINFKQIIIDILRLDGDKIFIKLKNFIIRNKARIKRISGHIWHEVKNIGKGFKTFKDDIQVSFIDIKDDYYSKYKKVSYDQSKNLQKVTNDVIKFIPFSLFIIVPGLELLLPAWLVIFPNSIPSQFLSPTARHKQMEELIQNRNKAAERLLYKYPKYLKRLMKSSSLSEEEKVEVAQLIEYIEKGTYMHTDLLKYKHLFKKYADFKHFKVNTLLDIAHFMGLKPITGLNTINNILSFVRLNIKLDNKYISWYTKLILRRELRMYMRKIRKEDTYLSMENINIFPVSKIDSILVERGIKIENRPIENKLKDYKIWQAISNLSNVPDVLLIFCRVNDFADSLYRVNHFEQEIDLIKRIGSNKLYLQRKNVLDDFLGVRKVKEYIDFVASLKQPSQTAQTGNNADSSAHIDDTAKQTASDSKVVSPPADAATVKQHEAALP